MFLAINGGIQDSHSHQKNPTIFKIIKNQIDDKLNLNEKNHSELEGRVTKLEQDVQRVINILTKMTSK